MTTTASDVIDELSTTIARREAVLAKHKGKWSESEVDEYLKEIDSIKSWRATWEQMHREQLASAHDYCDVGEELRRDFGLVEGRDGHAYPTLSTPTGDHDDDCVVVHVRSVGTSKAAGYEFVEFEMTYRAATDSELFPTIGDVVDYIKVSIESAWSVIDGAAPVYGLVTCNGREVVQIG